LSTPSLSKYAFCSWARVGVANQLDAADSYGVAKGADGQGQIQVTLILDGTPLQKPMTVLLYGPQHVTGLDQRAIIRVTPTDGSDNFEPNYLPAIEFSEPDLPWRYTPLGPGNGNLRPWICLVVLKGSLKSPRTDDEFTTTPPSPTIPLRQITVNPSSPGQGPPSLPLPDLTESYYWAHVQVASPSTGDLGQSIEADPSLVRSRLLCPRKLDPSTHYTAFLVPVFDFGAKAGRGEDISKAAVTADNAWDGTTAVTLPVYYSWEFSTGPGGDFESLVLALVPREPPADTIGTRKIDGSDPDPAVQFPPTDPPANQIVLPGALVSPSSKKPSPKESDAFKTKLLDWLDSTFKQSSTPKVGPPIYGKWYAKTTSIEDPATPMWMSTLNLHPSYRIPAGYGAEVVRTNRLQLLSAAWAQAAGIQQANQVLRQAQLSREALTRMHSKYIASAPAEKALLFTASVHNKVLLSPRTAGHAIRSSQIPRGSLSTSMQKAARPLGPFRVRQKKPTVPLPGMLSRLNSGDLNPAPPAPAPASTSTIDGVTNTFYPTWIPGALRPYLGYLWWFLLILITIIYLVGVFFFGLAALSPVLVGVAVAFIAAAVAARQFYGGLGPVSFTSSNLTKQNIQSVPPRSSFTLVTGAQAPAPASSGLGPDNLIAARFRQASSTVQGNIRAPASLAPTPAPIDIKAVNSKVVLALDPAATVRERIIPTLQLPQDFAWNPTDPLQEVVMGPSISKAMYEPLAKLSLEAFLPGIGTIKENTVAVLSTDQAFVEAYMVGVNHEMSKLLTFNGYPTDPRYTYFQQFWDKSVSPLGKSTPPDIEPILFWPNGNDLGDNGSNPASDKNNLVLFIYGKLFRRYPDTAVFAAHVKTDAGKRTISQDEHQPVFRCFLPPDITLFGFDITKDDVMAAPTQAGDLGFYFVIQQHPSQPKFRFENDDWANLTLSDWGYVEVQNSGKNGNKMPQLRPGTNATWGASGGDLAAIAYQEPLQVAYNAAAFTTPQGGG